MALVDLATVKGFLGITDGSRDAQITALLPVIRDDFVKLTCNTFADLPVPAFREREPGLGPFLFRPDIDGIESNSIFYHASTLAFVDADPPSITDSENGFLEQDFIDGLDVLVFGSLYNDVPGYYQISNDTPLTAGVMTLIGSAEATADGIPEDTLTSEDKNQLVRLARVQWPAGRELVISQMIGYQLQLIDNFNAGNGATGANAGVDEESLGDHSISFSAGAGGGGGNNRAQSTSVAYPAPIMASLTPFTRPTFS